MAIKKTNTGGKRVAKKNTAVKKAETKPNTAKKHSAVPAVIVICAVLLVAAVYTGLCQWAGTHLPPNSSVDSIELGGLTREEATARLEQSASEWQGHAIALTYNGTSIPCELGKANLNYDCNAVLDQLTIQNTPFLMRGMTWLKALADNEGHQAQRILVFEDRLYMDGLLTELNSTLSNPVEQHSIEVGEHDITITKGHAGQAISTEALEESLLTKLLAEDYSDLALEAAITQPDPIDFDALYRDVYIEPVNSTLDSETYEIIPHVTGVSIELSQARALCAAADEDETVTIPFVYTEPEITTTIMEESLFADMLGEAKSWVSGSSGRKSNVKLAASFCDGTILLPGDEFSYWNMIAPCTVEQGFQPAPTYLNGKTVDGIGGGVCQVSSSIYTAALYSNLEIVQRNQHTYAVGYLPDGCDAMVSSGSSDFKFKNNTEWPLKITAAVKDGRLTVQIWGTKVDDTYVKLEFTELSRTPHSIVYKIDDTIPVGTTKEEANGYTGRKTETYRCVYAGDGTLISRTFENKNNYRMRDEIILINSADAYKYGVDPVTGEKLPEGTTVTPTPAPTPAVTPEPTPSDANAMPDWLGGGTTTQAPVLSPEPTPTPVVEMPDWLRPSANEEGGE